MADPLTDEQLDALSDQELVDYLCTAAEELDILYVEIWLRRLECRGLKDAAVRKHSTKPFCALTIVGGGRQAPLAELILHALLFRLPHTSTGRPTGVLFDEMWLQPWAKSTVNVHHARSSQRVSYCKARQLYACKTDAGVATLLDKWYEAKQLPTLPRSAILTGSKPLPRLSTPPSPVAASPSPLSASSPSVPTRTALEPAYPVLSAPSAFCSRIRISPVPPKATVELLRQRLPELEGLCGVELAEAGAAVLTFADGEAAKRAREEILEAYCGRKPLTVTFLTSPTSHSPSCRRSHPDAHSGEEGAPRIAEHDYGAIRQTEWGAALSHSVWRDHSSSSSTVSTAHPPLLASGAEPRPLSFTSPSTDSRINSRYSATSLRRYQPFRRRFLFHLQADTSSSHILHRNHSSFVFFYIIPKPWLEDGEPEASNGAGAGEVYAGEAEAAKEVAHPTTKRGDLEQELRLLRRFSRPSPSASHASTARWRPTMTSPLTNEQLDALSDQELVDYLCTAVKELDVLYVEIWLRRLRDRGVKALVTRQHSHKHVCALSLTGRASQAILPELILHLLLFHLPTSEGRWPSHTFSGLAFEPWAWAVVNWKHAPASKDPVYLAAAELHQSSDIDAVADLLDRLEQCGRLPPHPDPNSCTGCNPLKPHAPPDLLAGAASSPFCALKPLSPPFSLTTAASPSTSSNSSSPTASRSTVFFPTATTSSASTALPPLSNPLPPQPRFPPDHPIRIRLGNLPKNLSREEIIALFHRYDIPTDPTTVGFGSPQDAFITVPHRAAFQLALKRLDLSYYPNTSYRIYLDRDRPDALAIAEEKASHPMVVLSGLGPVTTADKINRLARHARCGRYDICVNRSATAPGDVEGTFRTSSPFAAEQAVRALDGAVVDGSRVEARWVHMGEAAEEARRRDEERARARQLDPIATAARSSTSSSSRPSELVGPTSPGGARHSPPVQLPSPNPSVESSPAPPPLHFSLTSTYDGPVSPTVTPQPLPPSPATSRGNHPVDGVLLPSSSTAAVSSAASPSSPIASPSKRSAPLPLAETVLAYAKTGRANKEKRRKASLAE